MDIVSSLMIMVIATAVIGISGIVILELLDYRSLQDRNLQDESLS